MGQGTVLCPVADMSSVGIAVPDQERIGLPRLVVEELQLRVAVALGDQSAALPGVAALDRAVSCADGLGEPQTAAVVGEGHGSVLRRGADRGQLPPGHGRAVVPFRRVPDRVVGDCTAV